MGGSGSTRWRDYEGRWHEGFPPPGWYQAPNGHWYPQPPQPPPPAATGEAPAASPAGRMVAAYGRWPLWTQITTPLAVAFLLLAALGSMVEPEETVETSEPPVAVERTTTTTAPRPTTTTTTVVTTTLPPATTPPTAPPPTAAALPPPPPQPVVVEPPPAEEPGGGCHPSYSGCVPMASDVDCAGGSGDGPEYVAGPVEVYGSDPYDLDRDNDGLGCED